MKMVGRTAGGHEYDLFRLAYSRNVAPKRWRIMQDVRSLLGAEYAVKKGGSVGMCHTTIMAPAISHLSDMGHFCLCHAYGTQIFGGPTCPAVETAG